jgi:hypothetical protein
LCDGRAAATAAGGIEGAKAHQKIERQKISFDGILKHIF